MNEPGTTAIQECGSKELPHTWAKFQSSPDDRCLRCNARWVDLPIAWHENAAAAVGESVTPPAPTASLLEAACEAYVRWNGDDEQPWTEELSFILRALGLDPAMSVERLREDLATASAERQWENLARIEHSAAARWQEMAETLFEELCERHNDDCGVLAGCECDCLNPIRVLWDEITDAADWADEDEIAGGVRAVAAEQADK